MVEVEHVQRTTCDASLLNAKYSVVQSGPEQAAPAPMPQQNVVPAGGADGEAENSSAMKASIITFFTVLRFFNDENEVKKEYAVLLDLLKSCKKLR